MPVRRAIVLAVAGVVGGLSGRRGQRALFCVQVGRTVPAPRRASEAQRECGDQEPTGCETEYDGDNARLPKWVAFGQPTFSAAFMTGGTAGPTPIVANATK